MIDPECGKRISLLIPFRDDHAIGRAVNWEWLKRFWTYHLPAAQIVMGTDMEDPFSKTCATNNAFQKSSPNNDITVILDADCYIAPAVIIECARRIRKARTYREKVWFIPYSWLYRLTDKATPALVASEPAKPLQFMLPHNLDDVISTNLARLGHQFGALIQIMPREAFIEVGGMDPRFRGWGGEDVSMKRALDTLYATHRITKNEVLTLWHTALGDPFLRKWQGQSETGVNNKLAVEYRGARRDRKRMRELIEQWLENPEYAEHRIEPGPPWFDGGRYPPPEGSC